MRKKITFTALTIARRCGLVALIFLCSLVGTTVGFALGGHISHDIGPFHASLSVQFAVHGETEVKVPPLGSIAVSSHRSPLKLVVVLDQLDRAQAEQLISQPTKLAQLADDTLASAKHAAMRLFFAAFAAALITTAIISALIFRRPERVVYSVSGAALIAIALVAGTVNTWNPESIREPRYHGLLVNAPSLVGNAYDIADRIGTYRDQLQRVVANVNKLYSTASTLPVTPADSTTIRILHVSDIHLNPSAFDVIRSTVTQFNIDMVIDTGDITDWGSEPESTFVQRIGQLKVPYVFIRGNHDSAKTTSAIAKQPNAIVLNESTTTFRTIRIAGIADPRFTPDKNTRENTDDSIVQESGRKLADYISRSTPVDIALVHDPKAANELKNSAPVILAGHTHQPDVKQLDSDTTLFVEGSSGGAGLRGLEGEKPTPLTMTVMYFNQDKQRNSPRLAAYDDITVGGVGKTEISLKRHVVKTQTSTQSEKKPTSR